jgi:hypothetical protein
MRKQPSVQRSKNLKTAMLGVWQLESRIDIDASGEHLIDPILGADPLGILCFSSDHFAAQFMKRNRSPSADTSQAIQGANNSSALNGYDAYFGTYKLDESIGTLNICLEGSVSPSNVGSKFERHIQVRDNKLTIMLATTSDNGKPITRTLTFSRLT